MDRPVRGKKRPNHYDPAKEAAKPQWKKPKKKKDAPKENPKHIIFVSDEDEPAPPAHNGPVHTYFSDSD
jgi:hypothetical protein